MVHKIDGLLFNVVLKACRASTVGTNPERDFNSNVCSVNASVIVVDIAKMRFKLCIIYLDPQNCRTAKNDVNLPPFDHPKDQYNNQHSCWKAKVFVGFCDGAQVNDVLKRGPFRSFRRTKRIVFRFFFFSLHGKNAPHYSQLASITKLY